MCHGATLDSTTETVANQAQTDGASRRQSVTVRQRYCEQHNNAGAYMLSRLALMHETQGALQTL